MWKTLHVWVKNSHRLPNVCWGILHSKQTILLSLIPDEHPGDVAWENSDATNRFSAKWHLRNKCRNSILMMCCYPDLSSASDWFNKIVNRTKALPKSGKCWSLAWNLCSDVISRGNCSGGITKCHLFSQARQSFFAPTAGPLNLLKGQRGNGIKTTTKNGHSCKSKT